MNALYSWTFQRGLAGGPLGESLTRITIVLALAWLAHAALSRANPRWRVLTWRVAAIAVLLVPAMTIWGPAVRLAILPAESATSVTQTGDRPIASTVNVRPRRSYPQTPERHLEIVADSPSISAASSVPVSFAPAVPPAANPEPVAASDPPPSSQQIDWFRLSLAIWVGGGTLGLVLEFTAWIRLRQLRRRSRPASAEIVSLGRAIAARLGGAQTVKIRVTRELNSPCICGVLRPVILLGEVDCQPQHKGALPAILSHELAHAIGGDLRWNALWRL